MRLTRLTAENWMAYEAIDLDFGAVAQVAITGKNNHGKSALLDAIEWCLWGKIGRDVDQRSSDKFIRRGTDTMSVEVAFSAGGHDVEVRREKPAGKTSTLLLTVDGVEQRGHVIGRKGDEALTLDESQARIDALVGLGFDAMSAGPFMAQEQASLFMKMGPRDRKDLLIRLLGIDAYEPLARAAGVELVRAETTATNKANDVSRLTATAAVGDDLRAQRDGMLTRKAALLTRERVAVEAFTAARDAFVRAQAEAGARQAAEAHAAATKRVVAEATARRDDATARIAEYSARAAEERPEADLPALVDPTEVDAAYEAHAAAQAAVGELQALRAQTLAFERDLERATADRAKAQTVPCGAAGKYATCRFLTDVPSEAEIAAAVASRDGAVAVLYSAADREVEAREAMATWRNLTARADRARDAHRGHEQALAVWQAGRDMAAAELARAAGALAAATADLEAAQAAYADADARLLALPPVDLAALEADVRRLSAEAKDIRAQREEVEYGLGPVERQLVLVEQAEADLASAQADMAAAEAEADVLRVLAAAWHRDGIPTSLIEAAVPVLEAKANAVLERMPEDLALEWRTQRPTKKGGMAETLEVVVTIDGWESDYGLLSVGARFRVDLAIRLALADLLATRSGATIDTLWLDEPLAALDDEGREAAVDTLATLADDFGLIVAVSHHADMNDRFPARIRVTKEDGVSTAVMDA